MKKLTLGWRIAIYVLAVIIALAAALPFIVITTCQGHPAGSCINNLRMIDSGKEHAALVNKWPAGHDCDTPDHKALVNGYIKGDTTPICWQGGTYTYNPVGVEPVCSMVSTGRFGRTYPHRMPQM